MENSPIAYKNRLLINLFNRIKEKFFHSMYGDTSGMYINSIQSFRTPFGGVLTWQSIRDGMGKLSEYEFISIHIVIMKLCFLS